MHMGISMLIYELVMPHAFFQKKALFGGKQWQSCHHPDQAGGWRTSGAGGLGPYCRRSIPLRCVGLVVIHEAGSIVYNIHHRNI